MSPRKKLFQKTVMIRMPDDLCASLSALATRDGRTLSDFCRAVLRAHVEAEDSLAGSGPESGAVIPAKLREFVQGVVEGMLKKEAKRRGKT